MVLQTLLPAAIASPLLVTSLADDNGPGTLRNALAIAANGDTIDASGISGAIVLTNGELSVSNSVTIIGPGPTKLALYGPNAGRAFGIYNAGEVAISGMTITHFSTGVDVSMSRAIYNGHSMLTISNCAITRNADTQGGGIYNDGYGDTASLTIFDSTVSNNSAGYGGGIYNDARLSSNTVVSIYNSTVSGNSGNGGAIMNTATYANGLGGQIYIRNSTISSNYSAFSGGAIFNRGEQGIVFLKIQNSTFCGNNCTYYGGDILNDAFELGTAVVEIDHTIFSAGGPNETIFSFGDVILSGDKVTSLGYNISTDDSSGFLTGPGDQIFVDPNLGPLAHNGGPTKTHFLWPGSPAIDSGDPGFSGPLDFDQRGPGFARIVNGRVDIGAFEAADQRPTLQNVLSQLQGIRPGATNKANGNTLDKAIRALASSLSDANWADDSHLTRPVGKQVFANDVTTVKLLTALATSNKSGLDSGDLQMWIANIVIGDFEVAQAAISESAGDTTKARAAFNKGNAFVTAGNFSKAIQSYATAWKLAAPRKK